MDEIQKALVKAGRKDLAQEYFKKTTSIEKKAEYMEIIEMHPDWDDITKLLKKVWKAWKGGSETKSSDVKPARKEVLKAIESLLK